MFRAKGLQSRARGLRFCFERGMGVSRHVLHVMPKVQTIPLEHICVKKSLGISLSIYIYVYHIDIYMHVSIHI